MSIKGFLGVGAVLLLVIAAGCKKEEALPTAVVTFIIGDVTRNGQPVDIYDQVNEKDLFVTGKDSSCDVKIGESIIRIKENSKLEFSLLSITGGSDNLTLGLDGGQLLCKPKRLLKDESFTVRTPTAIAGVRGTQFTVTTDSVQTTQIKVYDGQVQVAKRVAALDEQAEKVLSVGTVVEESEAVVVTKADADAAAKKVEAALASGANAGDVAAVVELVKNDVAISNERVTGFQIEDFKNENRELIAVQEKPREVVVRVQQMIQQDRGQKQPEGRLLITRYEIYFIKNGKVDWERKLIGEPVRLADKVFVATADGIFCASSEGPIVWKNDIINDGLLKLQDDKLFVFVAGQAREVDIRTGVIRQ